MPWTTQQLQSMSREEFVGILENLNEQYHSFMHEDGSVSKTHALADRAYDYMLEIYETRFGKYTKIGAPAISSKRPWQRKYEPPVYLGSLDKVTTPEQLELWMRKHPGPYVDSSKVDGCSLLYEFPRKINGPCMLSTRGDEGVGVDMTHLLPFLNLPKVDTTEASVLAVRGELIILNSDFEKLQQEWRDAGCDVLPDVRSTVTSLCISQTIDLRAAKYAKFIAYTLYTSYERFEKPSRQLELLGQLGFMRPWFRVRETNTFEELTSTTNAFRPKRESDEDDDGNDINPDAAAVQPAIDAPLDYGTDGLVSIQDIEVNIPERGSNPKFAIAFKVQSECRETVVTRLEWKIKSNVINPKVHFEPVLIGTRWIKRANGKNANFMIENKVSVGARALVWFANEVIPDFSIIQPGPAHAESDILPMDLDWEWNKTHKAIVLKNHADSDAAKKQRLERFFKHLKSDGLGPANCLLMYERWKGDWLAILTSKPADYYNAKGTNKKSAQLLCEAIKACIVNVPLPRLMDASGCFGLGLGETKFKSVVAVYPDIMKWHIVDEEAAEIDLPFPDAVVLTMNKAIERIREVKLWQTLAGQFCTQLPVFQAFCNKHPMITWIIPKVSDAKVKASRKRKEQEEDLDHNDSDNESVAKRTKIVRDAAAAPEPTVAEGGGWTEPMPSHVVCTGFSFSRSIKAQLEERDVVLSDGVSKKTKMLVVEKHGTGSIKENKARTMGIPILTQAEFVARFALTE